MRILATGALQGQGGIQFHMRSFLKALDEAGFEVLCLSSNVNTDPRQRESIAEQFPFPLSHRVELVDFTLQQGGSLAKFQGLRRRIQAFRPDCFVACGHGWGNAVVAGLCGRKIPRIYFEVMVGEKLLPWKDSRRHYPWVFSHFFTQSEAVGEKLQVELGRPRLSFTAIHAFPQHHESLFPLPAVKSGTPKKGELRMAYFGRVVPHKRPRLMAEHFAAVQDLVGEYHVYGSGPEREEIERVARESGFAGRIVCHGRYPEGEAYYKLLAGMDFLVLPTIGMEGSPLVLLEAMSCGVPYVACDTGGIRDYTFPAGHGAVTGRSAEEFVAGVRQIAETLISGGINRAALQQHFVQHYSFQACKGNWLRELQRLGIG
ncbi:MAG: glycosyltransferase family 4 protein [Candidatus Sumerlaeia bacterium]|nr:glycosyltransferase family 4 protein [Candidatus Sumerlaeia bacterium]